MELHNLKPAEGAVKKAKRIGRGQGSGHGGTSTRGHKGAKSRSGYKSKIGFEGGQMPLQRRLPKRGFKNPFRKEYTAINLDYLQKLIDKYAMKEVTPEILREHNIISKTENFKILGTGELSTKINITAHAISETAKKKVEEKGGTVNIL